MYGMVVRLRLSPLPFMFACVYTANTASIFLPISNLTNLLVYDTFGLGFVRFGLIMLIPSTLAVLVNALVLAGIFRKDLQGSYYQKTPSFIPEETAFFRVAAGGIVGVLIAFFLAPIFGIPIGPVALAAGLIVVIAARLRGWLTLREVAGNISWGIIALVIGLFLVVQAVENAGLAEAIRQAFALSAPGDGLLQILGVAVGSALGSNLINNVPMTVMAIGALRSLVFDGTLGLGAIYATILGTSIGPNLTTVGSLATLIWLSITRGKGMDITAKDYLKIGAISTPVILLSAAVGLWISLRLFGS
jgi:arsenical pump membrane protein